ncbi:ComEC/Rec2 family competence protein [Vibrio sp. J383]|uniref:ComEC/Rec2 family competence protein n=2 Tax=Vibrio sp. J383 TaxID=2942997 RepID=UPI0030D75C49
MTSVNLTVLDIGHGNCTLIKSETSMTIIDAAQGNDLLNILIDKNTLVVDDLIISHADADHIGGAISLLMSDEIVVHRVHMNSEPMRNTKVWISIIQAIQYARSAQDTRLKPSIARDDDDIVYDNYKLEILAPNPVDCLTGAGTQDPEGRMLDANSMSVVLRLVHDSSNIALLPGDMDGDSLEFLKNEQQCLDAKILIFPHHGGLPGTGDPRGFSKELCELVEPDLILFSNSRRKHNNPIPDVIAGVRQSNCGAHLACTQVSESCCPNEQHLSSDHLIGIYPSKGQPKNHSCAGSVTITLNGTTTDVVTPLGGHLDYIDNFAERKCI